MRFWSVVSIVIGCQIGSGILMLPSQLANFGWIALAGWLISGAGAILLSLVFAQLCIAIPKTGGPHAYVEVAFGKAASFFTGWTYWIISWVSTVAVIITAIGYLTPIIGEQGPLCTLALELFLLVVITFLNIQGVEAAGFAELIFTFLKVVPLLIIPLVGLFLFGTHNFPDIAALPLSPQATLSGAVLLTLWCFIGLESATTPAESIINPTKTIPRAVVVGTLSVAFIYILNNIGMMSIIPLEMLAQSHAPYADASRLLFGQGGSCIVSLIAFIICIGTINAWVLTSGQIALGAAHDKLFPVMFSRTNRKGAPYWSLWLAFVGMGSMLIVSIHNGLVSRISFIIDLSVTAFLFLYLICVLAFFYMMGRQIIPSRKWLWLVGSLSLAFCLWAIWATPLKMILLSSGFIFCGIPVYFYTSCKRPMIPRP